jgi:hypothetical protein
MGLGFRARGVTVQLENGDGGRDGDSLCFYVAITLPQMPLSKIDGVVNLFSTPRANQIYGQVDHPICSAETKICSMF